MQDKVFITKRSSGGGTVMIDHPRSDFSRRSFLSGLVALAGAAGCADPSDKAKPCRPGRGIGAAPPDYEPRTPFSLSSQSVLSEDYFEIVNHKIDVDNGDKVVAYTRSNGDTEAVVLQDGVVKLVYRDSSQAGGWAVFALPDANGVTDMVAAVGQPISGAAYLEISYLTKDRPDVLVVATQPASPIGADGPTFTMKTVGWNAKAGPLAITMGASSTLATELEPLVSALVPGSERDSGSGAVVCWNFRAWSGVLSGFSFNTWNGDRSWSLSRLASRYTDLVSGGFVLDIAKADGSLEVWGLAGLAGGEMKRLEVPSPYPPQDASGMRTVVSDVVALLNLKFANTDALPTALVWTQHQIPVDGGALAGAPQLWLVTFNADPTSPDWIWTNLAVPTDQNDEFDIPVTTALTPRTSAKNGYLVDVFVSWGGTLRVVRQIEQGGQADATQPVFTPLIPLQPDVLAMSSQASPSAGNQLILVGADGTLQTLVKGAANGGWTDTVMHLPASELQEVSSYRVTLTLADAAWNAPVGGHDVVITASTPVLAVIEGPNPKTVLLGSVPVTATTDANGEVLLALLAEGLSAPTLTVISTGLPVPATVYPSEPINTYMQGTGTLNFLPTMNGSTLSEAKTPDGQTVAPGAADADAASEAANTMKQAAELAAQGTQLGAVASTVGRIDGSRLVSVELLGSSIDHWAQDVLHAVKKGAAAVEHVVVDAEKKIITIALDVENWVDNTVQIVVHTIEDAAHVLHAVLNKLKADIVNAVKWLRALVKSLLQDSARVAKQFSALLEQATAFVGDGSGHLKAALDKWFTGREKAIQDSFDKLRSGYSKNATLATISSFNPAKPGSTASEPPKGDDDDAPQPHGDWFLNKVKHAIYGELDTPQLKGVSYDKLQLEVLEACASEVGDLETAAQDFWLFLKTAVTHPSEFPTLAVPALLEAVSKLVQAALKLLNALLDALFDLVTSLSNAIPDMLRTKIGSAGIVGKLLSLAGLGDFEIGAVAMMVFAFPTTLAYKIANGPDTRPFGYLADEQQLGADPGADRALQITASSVMGVWAALDLVNTALDESHRGVPLVTPACDLAGPLLIGALSPPFVTDGLPDWRRMSDSTEDAEAFCSWILGLLPAYGAAQVLYATKSKAVDASETEETVLWVQTMCGVLSLVTGVLAANRDPGANGVDYAVPILTNISNITAFCGTDAIKDATEGFSIVLGAGLGFWSSVAGAVLYGLP